MVDPVKSPQADADRVIASGKLNKIIGFSGLSLDRLPLFVNTALTNLFGGASGNLINFVVPFDYKAIAAYANVTVAPGTGAATIGIGTTADTDGILDDKSIATNDATGFRSYVADVLFTGAALYNTGSQGDIIVFQTDGGGTATGKAVWGLTIVPN